VEHISLLVMILEKLAFYPLGESFEIQKL